MPSGVGWSGGGRVLEDEAAVYTIAHTGQYNTAQFGVQEPSVLSALDFLLLSLLREMQKALLLKFLSAVRMKSSAKLGFLCCWCPAS